MESPGGTAFLDVRIGEPDDERTSAQRRVKYIDIVGVDGSGKTRLVGALSRPETGRVIAERSCSTALSVRRGTVPYVVHYVDERVLSKGSTFTMSGKLPPPFAVAMRDWAGTQAFRGLWCDSTVREGIPATDAFVYVIGAHDPWRVPVAMAELRSLAERFPTTPILVTVVQTLCDRSPTLRPADVLKVLSNSVELPGRVSFIGADLRASDDTSSAGCKYSLAELRRIGHWIIHAAG